MKHLITLILSIFFCISSIAQNPLPYYLPVGQYDPFIPDPEEVLGYKPGEWHMTHDQLVRYMYTLADKSNRVKIIEYGRSHEMRPMFAMVFSHPDNLKRLDEIKEQRRRLWEGPAFSADELKDIPGVLYQGYSVHGNEASGGNASAIVAFYLAASKTSEVESLLRDNLVFVDPCFNPDGFNRFASWVNQNKNAVPNTDDNSRELTEQWPNGRTNHYWFDLNRDYLMTQHPETVGRIALFREWMPDIFTDHHEMGSNSTFFFQPGVPSRVHPLTPEKNQELTGKIGEYHETALNAYKNLYYHEEQYDDFFYGKGSTYPDVNGGIGILFEQASARGHLRETVNGKLSFEFAIRNQVLTSLSTQEAMADMKDELLAYKQDFFRENLEMAADENFSGIRTGSASDQGKNRELLRILLSHGISVYATGDLELPYYIPMAQYNYRLIKSLFEERTTFPDSIFYDISAWTLPHALGVPYQWTSSAYSTDEDLLIAEVPEAEGDVPEMEASYGYLIPWDDYYAPAAVNLLLAENVRLKVARKPFSIETDKGLKDFSAGCIFIPLQNVLIHPKNLYGRLKKISIDLGVDIYAVTTGITAEGPDLGSNEFSLVKMPKLGILTGPGVDTYEAGSIWYFLEKRYGMTVTMIDPSRLSGPRLERYTHLIAPGGIPTDLRKNKNVLQDWVNSGGILIMTGNALRSAGDLGLVTLKARVTENKNKDQWIPFGEKRDRARAKNISGSLFKVRLDNSHPIAFGYDNEEMAVFRRGTRFYDSLPGSDTPVRFSDDYLVSGYIPADLGDKPAGASYLSVRRSGRGKVILFSDSPNFRSYFWGTNKFVANALFFSNAF